MDVRECEKCEKELRSEIVRLQSELLKVVEIKESLKKQEISQEIPMFLVVGDLTKEQIEKVSYFIFEYIIKKYVEVFVTDVFKHRRTDVECLLEDSLDLNQRKRYELMSYIMRERFINHYTEEVCSIIKRRIIEGKQDEKN